MLDDEYLISEEETIKRQLEELKSRVTQLHDCIPGLKRCSRLSDLLQKMYEIRMELNQLEQDLLQTHLKCCISSKLRVPAEVVLALSSLSEKRHGVIIAIEHEDNLADHLQVGVILDGMLEFAKAAIRSLIGRNPLVKAEYKGRKFYVRRLDKPCRETSPPGRGLKGVFVPVFSTVQKDKNTFKKGDKGYGRNKKNIASM